MVQKKLPLINSAHGSDTRNIINEMIKAINDRGLEILSESSFLTWLDKNGINHRGEWDISKSYDRLSVVLNDGNSYTSVKNVPVGKDITDDEYWILTGNYDAQIEGYKQEIFKRDKAIGAMPFKQQNENYDTESIQSALENESKVILEYGKEYITDTTITIPENTVLDLNGAIIKPSKSHDIFYIKKGASVYGGKIDVRGTENYSGSAILIDGVERFNFHQKSRFRDLEIVGDINSNKGNAIMLKAVNPGDFVLWTIFNSITINGFDKGIYLKATKQSTGVTFVNGNTFSDIFISYCVYNIYIEGNNVERHPVEGNLFSNIIHQAGTQTKRILYCEGATNRFDMYIFDFFASPSSTAIELTETSADNFIKINGTTVSLIEDKGDLNEIKNPRSLSDNIIPMPNVNGSIFLGNQDDFLANSDFRYDVTIPSGHEISSGVLSSMFTLDTGVGVVFPNASKSNPLMIEIDMLSEPLSLLEVFGVNFLTGRIPKNIKVEVYNGTEWKTKINIDNNYKDTFLMRERESRVEKLRLTLSESLSSDIRIGRLFASSNSKYGRAFLNTRGGEMFGDVEFKNPARGIILQSANGDRHRLRVNNDGVLVVSKL